MSAPRMLIVGLDAATPALVERWAAEGRLPTLRRLIETGAYGSLRSVPNTSSPAAWSTFATGKSPARHGILFFTMRAAGSYAQRFVNGSMRDGAGFWRLLGDAGVRVGVMNVPMTFPAEPVNGFFISGLDAPHAGHPDFAYPPDLMARLRASLGDFVAAGSMTEAVGHDVLAGRYEQALRKLLNRMETRTRWAEHLLDTERPDLMTVVYTETDGAQHFFWKLMDPRHLDHDPALAARYGDAILRVYQKADEAIARLMAHFGDGLVLVVSDHGAGLGYEAREFVAGALRAMRLIAYEQGDGARRVPARRHLARSAYRWLNPRLPAGVRRGLRRVIPGVIDGVKAEARDRIDWTKTRAFADTAPGEIWLNVRGRQPAGIVEPGQEYDALRHEIAEALRSCVDADSGAPVVEAVWMREDLYQGPYADRAPDLYVQLKDTMFRAFRIGDETIAMPRRQPTNPREVMSGGHRPDGIVILHGPAARAGSRLTGARLQDIAATILHAFGHPVPDDLDGAVLEEAFAPEWLATHPVTYGAGAAADRREVHDFTEEEAAAIQQRLRNLGYL
ncbi:MAG: alkaline phosphatase family protein [Armatimonadota bacterium]|nr:alkaline phosphatase family protein [Armatimonadota bacterium]